MGRQVDNAFTRHLGGNAGGVRSQTLPPLRASLRPMPPNDTAAGELSGTALDLRPMRAVDALVEWSAECASTGCCTLLIGPDPLSLVPRTSRPTDRCSSDDLATGVTSCWEQLGQNLAVCEPGALRALLADRAVPSLTLVRVSGEIEARDAESIQRALLAGKPAWTADFRAVSTMQVVDDEAIRLETLIEQSALRLVAENVAHFLAALLDREPGSLSRPWPWQLKRLLGVTGSIMLRPEEADVYSTSVDLGVCTAPDGNAPAGQSLIYDRPSDSWHDEQ
ncbi:MAG: hypothetical protein KDA22_05125 [Phycisphaerales bacterium]|nr:hypothetical protein [Phycisphaerales bacterium]